MIVCYSITNQLSTVESVVFICFFIHIFSGASFEKNFAGSRGDFTPTHCSGSAEGLSAVSEMQDNLISGSKVEQRQCSGAF